MKTLTAITVILCMTPLWSSAAVIDVREKVAVAPGTLLRLKDVAQITESDPLRAAALAEITLGPAPSEGRSQRVTFEDVRSRLLFHGINLAEIELRGQRVTTVTTSATPAPSPRVTVREPQPKAPASPKPTTKLQQQQADQLLQSAVQRAVRLSSTESLPVRVTCTCDAEDVPLILATSAERIQFAEPQLQVGPPQSITAHWQTTDGNYQTAVVQVAVDLAPRRLAVRHPVPAGYPLQPDDLEWVTGEVDAQAITHLADAVGKETRRTLRTGQHLTADMLTTTPLVRSNDIVTVQVRRPGVTVRRMFKAQGTGGLHETIMLVAVDDPRLRVKGVVTGFHEATIVEQSTGPTAAATSGGQP
jgi:flagella basal body P-ring formation protein FlgA